ncbi:MAG TPA: hypothetical protein VJN88_15300 [Ktedonobacterales bacterium]|nr:hypothetical protein [Ktedonobacterales bacterium]
MRSGRSGEPDDQRGGQQPPGGPASRPATGAPTRNAPQFVLPQLPPTPTAQTTIQAAARPSNVPGERDRRRAPDVSQSAQMAALSQVAQIPTVIAGGSPLISTQPIPGPTAAVPSAPMQGQYDTTEPVGPRLPTLTQQLRSIQPPDVARQAMSELGVLARELATLPEQLEVSGLARTHQRTYNDAMKAYLGLARQAWESVAEERLEQSAAEPEYRQRAVAVARRVGQMQQECRSATNNTEFILPRKTPTLWSRRVASVRTGLRVWQEHIAPTPDPCDMGRGLVLLRGYMGLACAGSFELATLDFITSAVLLFLGVVGVGLLAGLVGAIISGSGGVITGLAIALLADLLVWALALSLTIRGPLPIGVLLGATVFAPERSTRHGRAGSTTVYRMLRGWWALLGVVGLAALLAGISGGGALAGLREPFPRITSVGQGFSLVGELLTLAVAPAAVVSLALLLLLGLPVMLVSLARYAAEFAGSPSWVPGARRYALRPAVALVAPVICALVVAAWIATTGLGWQRSPWLDIYVGNLHGVISARGVALLLALTLPYLALIAIPYMVGTSRWRRAWLSDLTARRADVESHVRRLSVSDPRSGAQDTSDENLRAMQYDLVLLQFYRDKIDEAHRTRRSPYRLSRALLTLLAAVAIAFLLDSAGVMLANTVLR